MSTQQLPLSTEQLKEEQSSQANLEQHQVPLNEPRSSSKSLDKLEHQNIDSLLQNGSRKSLEKLRTSQPEMVQQESFTDPSPLSSPVNGDSTNHFDSPANPPPLAESPAKASSQNQLEQQTTSSVHSIAQVAEKTTSQNQLQQQTTSSVHSIAQEPEKSNSQSQLQQQNASSVHSIAQVAEKTTSSAHGSNPTLANKASSARQLQHNEQAPADNVEHSTQPHDDQGPTEDDLKAMEQFDSELNALSKNLDVLAVSPSAPAVVCPGCKEAVLSSDTRLVVKDNIFHEACFKCSNCSTLFSNVVPFIEQDNAYFCEPCHEKKFGMFCAHCDALILGKVLKAMNKTWHPDHFTCFKCKRPFEDAKADANAPAIEYIEKEGNAYCAGCYKSTFLPKCAACTLPIENLAINALNAKWHEKCFKCQKCDLVLSKEVYALNDKPCCKRHFYEHNGNICSVCNDIIDKEFVSVADKKLHIKCFTCNTCKGMIEDSYYQVDGLFYCPKDVQAAMNEFKKKKAAERAAAAAAAANQ